MHIKCGAITHSAKEATQQKEQWGGGGYRWQGSEGGRGGGGQNLEKGGLEEVFIK